MNYPFVSLLVINYNGKELLERNLPSLIQTDYPNFEILIVDNASSDGSLAFVKNSFPNLQVIPLTVNSGYVGAVNVGAKYARGSILGILNTDVRVHNDWLKELVNVLMSDNSIAAVAPKKMSKVDSQILDGAGGQINMLLIGSDSGYLELDCEKYSVLKQTPYPPGAAYLIRREIFEKCGYLLDPDLFMYFDDPEVGTRLYLLGYSTYYVPSSKVYHERSATAGHLSPKILCLFRRNQLIYIYKLFGPSLFLKFMPVITPLNMVTTLYYATSEKDGRFLKGLFVPIIQFIGKFRAIELGRKQILPQIKRSPDSYFANFSGELVLMSKPSSTFLSLMAASVKVFYRYLSWVKVRVPPITSIRIVDNSDKVELYKI